MSAAEDMLALDLKAHKIPYIRQFKFHETRKWKADFHLDPDILVEVEGITYFGKNKDGSMKLGRHQTAKGYAADCEKYNAATVLGYRVLRYTSAMINEGLAIEQIQKILSRKVA